MDKKKSPKATHLHKPNAIGPVPVIAPANARDYQRVEDIMKTFVADRKDPLVRKLAARIGWERVDQMAAAERETFEKAKNL
jgi:hypothetical protein